MTIHFMPVDIERAGSTFIPTIVGSRDFQASGVAYGRSVDSWWVVVDPRLHPLYVWRRSGTGMQVYGRTAQALGAAVFSNGLMPGKRFSRRRKVTRSSALLEFALWSGIGAIGGCAAARGLHRRLLAGAAGGMLGFFAAWQRTFTNWLPCGRVQSEANSIDDRRNFDNEGPTHTWFGRFANDFASYRIGDGDLPLGVLEGSGGLISLVRDFKPPSKSPDDPRYAHDFASLFQKKGVVAWGLVPLDQAWDVTVNGEPGPDGVVVVFGSSHLDAEAAAQRLCAIGTRDAVALDQRASIMLGTDREFMIGPPPIHRQGMQTYGFYCR